MIEVIQGAIVYANLLVLLSIGLTITYMTTGVPNFAQGSFAVFGSYVALSLLLMFNIHPYLSLPLIFLSGCILGLMAYALVLKPLIKRGASTVMLMISTLALDLILLGSFGAYAEYLAKLVRRITTRFIFTPLDFSFGKIPGILLVSSFVLVVLLLCLCLFIYKTKFGIALRASMENPSLAQVMGINVELTRAFSWMLSGSLAAVAGCLLPFRQEIVPASGSIIVVSIFAASIVGGITNIWGALLGGYTIGISESLVTYGVSTLLGPWILFFGKVVAFMFLVVFLILAPKGLIEINWRRILVKREW